MNCVPPNHIEALALNVMVFRDGTFGKYLNLDEVMRVRCPLWDQCPYKKRKRSSFSLQEHTPRKERPFEDPKRRWPSASQEESLHQELIVLAP